MRVVAVFAIIVAAAFTAGLVWAQDGEQSDDYDRMSLLERLEKVRREVKVIDLDTALQRVPAIVDSTHAHKKLLEEMESAAKSGKDLTPLLERGRQLKIVLLNNLNEVLKLHKSKYSGASEQQVWERLQSARFSDITYRDEWLVNILDDLEEKVGVNIEIDARIYKFDTVTFDFEKTSARAMLQILGDGLLFKYVVRGDTLYVFKERHEILFGGEWIKQKKAAWRARKDALAQARKEAEAAALEGGGEER